VSRDREGTHLDWVTDDILALIKPYTHREPLGPLAARLHGHRDYHAEHPPLLDQLRAAIQPGNDDEQDTHGAFGSRSPVADDALCALMRIESAAADWLVRQFKRNPRGSTEANLRGLIGAAHEPRTDPHLIADLAYEAGRWLTWAKVETGWQAKPLTIADPCPATVCAHSRRLLFAVTCTDHTNQTTPCPTTHCDRTRSVRIRYPDGDFAWCTACGTAWSEHHPDLPSVLLLVNAITARRVAA
jgi:hypothetical protein